MSKEMDILPALSRDPNHNGPSAGTDDLTAKTEKTTTEDEKTLDSLNTDSIEQERSEDFPWRWKLTALALGVFLSGECVTFIGLKNSSIKCERRP